MSIKSKPQLFRRRQKSAYSPNRFIDSLHYIRRRMLCKESINLCGECALFCRQNSCGSNNDLKIRFLDSIPSRNMFLAINLEVLTKKNAMEVVQMEINCGSNLVLVVVVKTQKGPKQKKSFLCLVP